MVTSRWVNNASWDLRQFASNSIYVPTYTKKIFVQERYWGVYFWGGNILGELTAFTICHTWVYVMSIHQTQDMKSKCHISLISWTNYIFGEIETLCYINFKKKIKQFYHYFSQKSFVQEVWEMWHFDFMSYVWHMTL